MSERPKFPEFFVTQPSPCPYVAGRLERKLFTHITPDKTRASIDMLLVNGFRRSQHIAYVPYCTSCHACVSVRVVAAEFQPSRTQRRIRMRNHDLQAERRPPVPTTEQFALFRDYIARRHPDGGMADMGVLDYAGMVEDSMVETMLVEYRLPKAPHEERGRLVGVSLQDILSDGISMVYSFFDPDLAERSLGTHMIMDAVASLGEKPYLYLGYWIQRSDKMGYKERFRPQEMLTPQGWVRRVDGPVPARDEAARE